MSYTGPGGTLFTGINPQLYRVLSQGTDTGTADPTKGAVTQFDVYMSVDGGTPLFIGSDGPVLPDGAGVFRDAGIVVPWLLDGQPHSYAFYSRGHDKSDNIEDSPVTPDYSLTNITFLAVPPLTPVGIDVNSGASQRSYVTTVDVAFPNASNLSAFADANGQLTNRIKVLKYVGTATASTIDEASGVPVSGITAASGLGPGGMLLTLNFSATPLARSVGIGDVIKDKIDSLNDGNGFYRIFVDTDGNGSFTDASDSAFLFHRLLGDVNGDCVTDANDGKLIDQLMSSTDPGALLNGDLNRDGKVNSLDKSYTTSLWGNLGLAIRKLNRDLFAYLSD
ncbi:MAG: dockerin type I domain-containing protein [Planctomycetaceae bacterium]